MIDCGMIHLSAIAGATINSAEWFTLKSDIGIFIIRGAHADLPAVEGDPPQHGAYRRRSAS